MRTSGRSGYGYPADPAAAAGADEGIRLRPSNDSTEGEPSVLPWERIVAAAASRAMPATGPGLVPVNKRLAAGDTESRLDGTARREEENEDDGDWVVEVG
jgi:hypothetical protein